MGKKNQKKSKHSRKKLEAALAKQQVELARALNAPPVSPEQPARRFRPTVIGRPSPEFEPVAIGEDYRSTPYRPDACMDGWGDGTFTVRGATLRGRLHRYNGAPRQDDMAILRRRDAAQLIVAVADGVSSAAQSHIGATTAARYAVQWLDAQLDAAAGPIDWKAMVDNVAWALVEQASTAFGIEKSADVAEPMIATTLVCALVEQRAEGGFEAQVVSIGDSGCWLFRDGAFERVRGGKDSSGSDIASSAVTGLPRVPSEVRPATVSVDDGTALLIGTDGFGDPLGEGSGDVGTHFADMLSGQVPSMFEFAHGLDFSRDTFDDDRTLVAVWCHSDSEPAGP